MKRELKGANKKLTVGELRAMLEDVPSEYIVLSEGCDCIEPADGIRIDEERSKLTITREPF